VSRTCKTVWHPFSTSQPAKHQIFQRHAPHLPELTLFFVDLEAAFPCIIETDAHLEHAIAMIVTHCNRVIAQRKYHRFLQFVD
jgi:hypothetical protein